MKPSNFNESNVLFTAPEGMEDRCGNIKAAKSIDEYDSPCIITCWQVSKEELEEIQKTGKIYLITAGHNFPPTSITPYNPFQLAESHNGKS